MYEVQNRSILEHQTFSFEVERQNLKWLYHANMDYCDEMQRVSRFETLADHASLKGKVFKKKLMSPARLKGLTAFGFSALTYSKLHALTLLMGSSVCPAICIAGAIGYGMRQFNETQCI